MTAAGLADSFPVPETPGPYLLISGSQNDQTSGAIWHPIGVIGQAAADWQASRDSTNSLVAPWRGELNPKIDDLPDGGWLITRGSGFLSFSVSASIGYDLNFLPGSELPGIGRLLQTRIAAVCESLLGCKINDTYQVVLNRESDAKVRLRVFRVIQKQEHAGIDLTVGMLPGQPAPLVSFLEVEALRSQMGLQLANAIPQLMRSNVAAAYERTTQETALLDATFDLQQAGAKTLFEKVTGSGELDVLFRDTMPGVQLDQGLLTHGLTKSLQIQIHLPFLEAKPKKLAQTLASLQVEENAGRVLVYRLQSEDRAWSDRFRSELAILGQVTVENGKLNLDGLANGRIGYRTRRAKTNVLLQHDVTLSASLLTGWFQPRGNEERAQAAQRVSVALQDRLKTMIPQLYFSDRIRLDENATTAPLLVWAALPASPKIYWDWRSAEVRAALMRDPRTVAKLREQLAHWGAVDFLGSCLQFAAVGQGSELLQSLFYTESQLVWGAKKALDKLKDVGRDAANAPTRVLRTLAAFGDQIATAFHGNLSIYGATPETRWLNSFLFAAASGALAEETEDVAEQSVLTLYFLRPDSGFHAADFLNGATPPTAAVQGTRVTTNFPALNFPAFPAASDAY